MTTPHTTWTVPARVIRVIDGDTLECDLDLGWHITYRAKVRLSGVNCPELSTEAGQTARAFVINWLQWRAGAEPTPITVTSRSLDKYGRVLGDVTTFRGVLSADLIEAGHAVEARQ